MLWIGWLSLSLAFGGELSDGAQVALFEQGYRVGADDVLDVRVVGQPELSKQYTIQTGGYLEMPFVGRVPVATLTVNEIVRELVERYEGDWLVSPQITVAVAEHRAHKVMVAGEGVKKPDEYYLTGTTGVLEMLTRAGWIGQGTESRDIELSREDGVSRSWALSDLMLHPDQDVSLRNGDRILVREGHVVYLSGEVKKPGSVTFVDGLTFSQALNLAGGPTELARMRGAYILRDGERILVNVKKVQAGRSDDPGLRPGDQLFLKESAL